MLFCFVMDPVGDLLALPRCYKAHVNTNNGIVILVWFSHSFDNSFVVQVPASKCINRGVVLHRQKYMSTIRASMLQMECGQTLSNWLCVVPKQDDHIYKRI